MGGLGGGGGQARPVRRAVIALTTGLVLASGARVPAQTIGYTASVFGARGTYPASRATSVFLVNSVDVATGPLRVTFAVPVVHQRTVWTGTAVDALTGIAATGEIRTTAFGDPLVRVDVRVLNDPRRALQVGLAASVKLPVVDPADGIGTGKGDVAIGASLFKTAGRASVFADVLFWKYGDPEGVEFQDSLSYSIGAGRMIADGRWSAMFALAGFSRGIDAGSVPLQLNASVLALASRHQSLAVTAGVGLNDASGDFSLGASWRVSWEPGRTAGPRD